MITFSKDEKKLVIPSALGNFGNAGGGSGSGLTPEEVAEIASAVTEAAIEEYDAEIQVDLEEIRDAISGNTDTLLDLAVIAAMSVAVPTARGFTSRVWFRRRLSVPRFFRL